MMDIEVSLLQITINLEFLRYVRSIEPIKLKLRRWFLSEDNFTPDSIRETKFYDENITLERDTVSLLTNHFLVGDKELYFGVTRNLLKKIFNKMGCFTKADEKREFYFEGPYRRKVKKMNSK
jgi:hypothetical protein